LRIDQRENPVTGITEKLFSGQEGDLYEKDLDNRLDIQNLHLKKKLKENV